MGVLWYDARKTSALASFDKGIVYLGDGMFREQIGRYDSEFIYDKYGKTVAKIVGNTANNPALWSAESYCTSDCSRIYKSGSTYNATLASYDGESDGALAAAVLYFNLNNAERNSDNSQGINNNTKTHSNSDSNPPIGIPFDGSFIVIVLLVLADTFFFYFTDWGHRMLFQEEAGLHFLALTGLSSVIVLFFLLKMKDNSFISALLGSLAIYPVTYILMLINVLVEGSQDGRLNFGSVFIMIIGDLIATMGVATPFCLITAVVAYIIKKTTKDEGMHK